VSASLISLGNRSEPSKTRTWQEKVVEKETLGELDSSSLEETEEGI